MLEHLAGALEGALALVGRGLQNVSAAQVDAGWLSAAFAAGALAAVTAAPAARRALSARRTTRRTGVDERSQSTRHEAALPTSVAETRSGRQRSARRMLEDETATTTVVDVAPLRDQRSRLAAALRAARNRDVDENAETAVWHRPTKPALIPTAVDLWTVRAMLEQRKRP